MDAEFDAESLVEIIYDDVYQAAVKDAMNTMADPPGRDPGPEARALQEWYVGLSDHDRSMLRLAVQEAADSAVFGLLAILDGSRSISDTTRRELKVTMIEGNREVVLTPDGPAGDLHDIFRSIADERKNIDR